MASTKYDIKDGKRVPGDLDERLLEAIYKGVSLNKLPGVPKDSVNWFKTSPNSEVWEFVIDPESIKQAFIDAGWEAPVKYDKPPKQLFGDSVPFDPKMVISHIPVSVMTGQEWYDRFWAEFTKTPASSLAKNPHLVLDYVDLAAKKAADIE